MEILGKRGDNTSNILRIRCACGHVFDHRADEDVARCPKCHGSGKTITMNRLDQGEK